MHRLTRIVRSYDRLATPRMTAFALDWLLFIVYAAVIFFAVSPFIQPAFDDSPFVSELVGMLCVTLPLVLYFTISEWRWGHTVGKRLTRLKVQSTGPGRMTLPQSVIRNVMKFAPWELAHFAIWHAFLFPDSPLNLLGYGALCLSYILVGWYGFCLLFRPGRAPYESLSRTRVVR